MLSEEELRKVAAFANADLRTVKKAYGGGRVYALVNARITKAAKELKLNPPPGASK